MRALDLEHYALVRLVGKADWLGCDAVEIGSFEALESVEGCTSIFVAGVMWMGGFADLSCFQLSAALWKVNCEHRTFLRQLIANRFKHLGEVTVEQSLVTTLEEDFAPSRKTNTRKPSHFGSNT